MGWLALEDLKIRCVVGVHSHEREMLQELSVDVQIEIPFEDAAGSDQLSHTVDYAAMADYLADWAQTRKFKLIETMAEKGCDLFLEKWPQITRCRMKVKKPSALPAARHASATAERART